MPKTSGVARMINASEMSSFHDASYVDRRNARKRLAVSPFANPFRIYGASPFTEGTSRSSVIRMYRDFLGPRGDGRPLLARLPELRGKPLVCWCRRSNEEKTPNNACHADILI